MRANQDSLSNHFTIQIDKHTMLSHRKTLHI